MLEKYKNTSDPEEKDDILPILASTKSPKNIEVLFELLKDHSIVKPQDHPALFIYMRRNSRTREKTFDYLIENWDDVAKIAGEKTLEDYPRFLASTIRTEKESEKFHQFFERHENNPLLSRSISVAYAEIASRLALIASDAPAVVKKVQKLSKNL